MLFYHPELKEGAVILGADESGHIVRVLRKGVADTLKITDGNGLIAEARITMANPKKCQVEIFQTETFTPDPYYVHIAIAPTKNIDRIGWFIEKAVEMGIHEISFPICKHNERRVLNTDKLIAKAISAMKQSLSPYLPKINEAAALTEFLRSGLATEQKFLAHLENESTPELTSKAKRHGRYCVLVGPEGDFDASEIKAALSAGFEMVKMGQKRLRTETAALHACSLLNGINY